MKSLNIKSSLTIRFIVIFGGIWLVASVIIYLASRDYRQEEFYRRLYSKAELTARLLIDEDQIDADLLRKIEDANPVKLPNENIWVFNYDNEEVFSTSIHEAPLTNLDVLDDIRLEGEVRWIDELNRIEVLGILYRGVYDRHVVIASASDLFGWRKLENLRNILIIAFLSSLVIAGLSGRFYAGKALEPINEVIEEVNRISEKNLHSRVSEGNGHDEIAQLGITFNRMIARVQAAFESQKSFISNSSHELRTPMTGILSQIDLTLIKERTPENYQKALENIRLEVLRLSGLTSKLLQLTRLDTFPGTLEEVRVDSIVWQSISDFKENNPKQKISVKISEELDDPEKLEIKGNEPLLRSMLINLVENAHKYGEGRDIGIEIHSQGQKLVIVVSDKGMGIPPSDLAKIGSPFFRASNSTAISGSGIGLNLVKRIVQMHGGDLQIQSELGKGSSVSVIFPLI